MPRDPAAMTDKELIDARLEQLRGNDPAAERNALNGQPRAIIKSIAEIKPEALHWLWKPWLAEGEFHLLAGRPGVGKTTVALNLAAKLSSGDPPFSEARRVLLVLQEDNWAKVLIHRLNKAGANPDNLDFCESVTISEGADENEVRLRLDSHIETLAERARDGKYALIVLEPILRVAGQIRDSHNASQLRQALDPVEGLAQKTGAAILGITHFRKQSAAKAGPVLDSILGSQAWTAVARLVWIAFPAQDSGSEFYGGEYEYCLGLAKSNLGIDRAMIPYDIVAGDDDVTSIDFGTEQAVSATAVYEGREPGAREQAANWIRANVPPGEAIPSATIKTQAEGAGLSWRTLSRAKDDCFIQSVKRGEHWCWLRPG